jgi:hypothetical protein
MRRAAELVVASKRATAVATLRGHEVAGKSEAEAAATLANAQASAAAAAHHTQCVLSHRAAAAVVRNGAALAAALHVEASAKGEAAHADWVLAELEALTTSAQEAVRKLENEIEEARVAAAMRQATPAEARAAVVALESQGERAKVDLHVARLALRGSRAAALRQIATAEVAVTGKAEAKEESKQAQLAVKAKVGVRTQLSIGGPTPVRVLLFVGQASPFEVAAIQKRRRFAMKGEGPSSPDNTLWMLSARPRLLRRWQRRQRRRRWPRQRRK